MMSFQTILAELPGLTGEEREMLDERLYELSIEAIRASFLAMWECGVEVALTADQHFVQAGFRILMGKEALGVAEPAPIYCLERINSSESEENWLRSAA